MGGSTSHYGLQKLDANESFAVNGYKYVGPDRDTIDRILYLGATGHKHDGASGIVDAPDEGPVLTLDTAAGIIPAGTRVAYKYTWVDIYGNETAASPESSVTTDPPLASPGAPAISTSSTGGTLLSGNYYYVLSVYETNTNRETMAINPSFITISAATETNTITLTLPSLPAGADGFNVYRQAPGDSRYYFLDSVSTPTYLDDGVDPNPTRTIPQANTTNSVNNITVLLPGATPGPPDGFTWRIYRSYTAGDFNNSLLVWIVEDEVSFDDLGYATSNGVPPLITNVFPSPSKIDLATEVQGVLPAANVEHPFVVTFSFPGTLSAQTGIALWVCEFAAFTITGCRASLGIGSVPSSQSVIVDVNRSTNGGTSATTIYTTQANRPKVTTSQTIGTRTVPDVTALTVGQALSVDLDQTGGGASPTDHDLTINIYGLATI